MATPSLLAPARLDVCGSLLSSMSRNVNLRARRRAGGCLAILHPDGGIGSPVPAYSSYDCVFPPNSFVASLFSIVICVCVEVA